MKTFKSVKNSFSPNNSKKSQNIKNSNINQVNNKIIPKSKTENLNNPLKKNPNKKISKQKNFNTQLFQLEKNIYIKFKQSYSHDNNFYNIKIINEIISNENSHVVAEFKDYLIVGDYTEFLQKFYSLKDSLDCLPNIYEYYESCSVIFPNYVILPESKYIYKNIQRKQRVIDQQQELEDEKEKKDKKYNQFNKKSNINDNEDLVFNDKAIDSILNQTDTSGVKLFFGLNNENDNSNTLTMDNVVRMIDNAEKEKIKVVNSLHKKNFNNNIFKNNIPVPKINSKIKGRNHKRYISEGLSNSKTSKISKNSIKISNKKNEVNNNKDISSIYMDQKYNNNTIYISSPTQMNKNNKPLLISNLLTNNNNNITIKALEEKHLIKNQKFYKFNITSPLSKSSLNKNNKSSTNNLNQNTILSPSSSNLVITGYTSKKKLPSTRISVTTNKINKTHQKIKSQNNLNASKKNILSSRGEIHCKTSKNDLFEIFNKKFKKIDNKSSMKNHKKISSSTSSVKRILISSMNKEINNSVKTKDKNINDKNNVLEKKLIKIQKNKSIDITNSKKNTTYISVTHRNYNPQISNNNNSNNTNNNTITKTNTNISRTDRINIDEQNENFDVISPKKSSDFEKILKTYECFPSNNINERNKSLNSSDNKKIKRRIISNNFSTSKRKNIKGIQIKGFNDIIHKSRNLNIKNEKSIDNNFLSKTNRYSTSTLSNKVLNEMYNKQKKKK